MKIDKRLSHLEQIAESKTMSIRDVKFTEEEESFIHDLQTRLKKAGTNFYHEVCNPEEFERIKRLSTKMTIVYMNQKRAENENK